MTSTNISTYKWKLQMEIVQYESTRTFMRFGARGGLKSPMFRMSYVMYECKIIQAMPFHCTAKLILCQFQSWKLNIYPICVNTLSAISTVVWKLFFCTNFLLCLLDLVFMPGLSDVWIAKSEIFFVLQINWFIHIDWLPIFLLLMTQQQVGS